MQNQYPMTRGIRSDCLNLHPARPYKGDVVAAVLLLSGNINAARYLTSSSSTTKFSVALGGMVGFTPDVPYACIDAHA